MKTNLVNNELTIFFEGRIDSVNAPVVEKECKEILASQPHEKVVVDMEDLAYISSAGLRIILTMKKSEANFRIINVQRDVYDIFETTGFSEMMDISKAFRKISVDGCKVIGKGAVGTVYKYLDDAIVKVYRSGTTLEKIYEEKNKAKLAFTLGIPTAISFDVVKVGDAYGTVFEMLNASTMSSMIIEHPENLQKYAVEFADVLKTIHNAETAADILPTAKVIFADIMLGFLKGNVDAETEKHVTDMINAIPASHNIIHGDYHTNNILMQNEEPVLIDMDKLSSGNKIFELGAIYSTYVTFGKINSERVAKFMGFPYESAVKFYEYFFNSYFADKTDEEKKSIQKKIELMAYLRHLRHAFHHMEGDEHKVNVAMCTEKISVLSKEIDSLAL